MTTRAERWVVARTHHHEFIQQYPFHTAVIARMHIVSDPTVETMGVSMADGRLILHVNERWADAHADTFVGLLLHEVHHVVLGHLVDALQPGGYLEVGTTDGAHDHLEGVERCSTFLYKKP